MQDFVSPEYSILIDCESLPSYTISEANIVFSFWQTQDDNVDRNCVLC